MRYTQIDGLRGYLLLFMGLMHFNEITDVLMGKLNHHYFGWVQDAQGFIMISGIVVGVVFGREITHLGQSAMIQRVLRRTRTIYSYHAAMVLLALMAALAIDATGAIMPKALSGLLDHPVSFVTYQLLLVDGIAHFGILPMYVWFMLATPLIIIGYHRGHAPTIMAASIAVWLVAQLGVGQHFSGVLSEMSRDAGFRGSFGIYFNVFAWQIIYVAGLLIGLRMAQRDSDWSFIRHPSHEATFMILLFFTVLLGFHNRAVYWEWLSLDFSDVSLVKFRRPDFSVLHLVSFATVAAGGAWLVIAGHDARRAWIRHAANLATLALKSPPFVLLGRYSLQVFSFHLVGYYVLDFLLAQGALPGSELGRSVVLVLSVLALWLPALWLHHAANRAKARRPAVTLTLDGASRREA